MKKLLFIVFVLITQINLAQVSKNLGDFDKVKVFDKFHVKLIPSSENKIIISGTRENEVEIINKNGELKIRMPFPKLLSGNDILVQLFYKKLESISASEGSFVSSDTSIKQTSIDLSVKEGAEININLDVENANIRAVSGGIIELSGEASHQDVVIFSGGVLKAKKLHTSQTNISVSAGGNAEIFATTLVDAKVKAGGSVYIYGKPKQINKETFIGGTIAEK